MRIALLVFGILTLGISLLATMSGNPAQGGIVVGAMFLCTFAIVSAIEAKKLK